jgi:quinohemoprotein ethanol dehydrogenase
MLVFKIGGKATLPAAPEPAKLVLDPPPFTGTAQQVADGQHSYQNSCSFCHGDAALGGVLNPNLQYSASLADAKLWQQIVHDGLLKENGMVGWSANFSPQKIENIRQYVIKRANEDKALEAAAAKPVKTASR